MKLWLWILLLPLLLVGCTPQTEGYIDFSSGSPLEFEKNIYNDTEEKPLRIAVASVMSSNMTITSYRNVAQYISEKINRPVVLIQRKTYDEVNLLMSSGEADVAFMSTGGYASYRGINKVEVLVTQEYEGVDTYYVYIVTNNDNDNDNDNVCVYDTHAHTHSYEKYIEWLSRDCPHVAAMEQQMTEQQYTSYVTEYGKDVLFQISRDMENRQGIESNRSVYMTARKWAKRQK